MIDRSGARAWTEALRAGWADGDARAIGDLFTEAVAYRTSPFEPPLQGRRAVVDHWRGELSGQDLVDVAFAEPLIDGDRVAVEWWAVVSKAGAETTDSGALVLEFTGSLCSRLHEYWMLSEGRVDLPDGYRILRGSASR